MSTSAHKKKRRLKPVPKFASIEQEAEFWDTHNIFDYVAEWTVVDGPYGKVLVGGIKSKEPAKRSS